MHFPSLWTSLVASALIGLGPAQSLAQHEGGSPPLASKAPHEATQYDFLVGQWELDVKQKATTLATRIHGMPKMSGTWKASRGLDGWGVEDELRIVDASGNPLALTHFVRVYDAAAKQWSVAAIEAYHGRITTTPAQWQNGEMQSTSHSTDQDGKAFTSRTRLYKITPTSFRYQQDRSYDDGKTWSEGFLTIDAKRVAAPASRH